MNLRSELPNNPLHITTQNYNPRCQPFLEPGKITSIAQAKDTRMLIQFDLNHNDLDALLRHCQAFRPSSDDVREDRRLADAMDALAEALEAASQAPQN